MRASSLALLVLISILWGFYSCAYAEEQTMSYDGSYSSFYQPCDGGAFYFSVARSEGNLFTSKTILYKIDLASLSSSRVYSVRKSDSKVFVLDDNIYFTQPHTLLDFGLVYGEHSWCKVKVDKNIDTASEIFKNRHNDRWKVLFPTVDGVYCRITEGRFGHCELFKLQDNSLIPVLSADNSDFYCGHSFVIIDEPNRTEQEILKIYDICNDRIVTIPYREEFIPETIIYEDKVYYTTQDAVKCFDIEKATTTTVYESVSDYHMHLCVDGEILYSIEYIDDQSSHVHAFSIKNGQYLDSLIIPMGYETMHSMIINGILIFGLPTSGELLTFDLNTQASQSIPLE